MFSCSRALRPALAIARNGIVVSFGMHRGWGFDGSDSGGPRGNFSDRQVVGLGTHGAGANRVEPPNWRRPPKG